MAQCSGDGFKSSRSIAGKNFPNFEMLDARIASALNKIIQNSHFKKKVCVELSLACRRVPLLHLHLLLQQLHRRIL